ncbi:MAG: ABC transporter ATP-binding protein [Gammaproteobacteria bacterium]|nr:ABC transporter ATP-binding protein [Gammaproteobacteria bacterium]
MPNLTNHKKLLAQAFEIMLTREYAPRTAAALLLSIFNSAASIGGPYLLGAVLSKLQSDDRGNILGLISAMVLTMATVQMLPTARALVTEPLKYPLPRNNTAALIHHYLDSPVAAPLGEITHLFEGSYGTMTPVIPALLMNLIPTTLEALVAAAFIGYLFDPGLAALLVGTAAISILIAGISATHISDILQKHIKNSNFAYGQLVGVLKKRDISNIFNRTAFEAKLASKALSDYEKLSKRTQTSLECVAWLQKLILTLGFIASLIWATNNVLTNKIPPAYFLTLIVYLLQFIGPLNNLAEGVKVLNNAAAQLGNVRKFLSDHPARVDAVGSMPLVIEGPISIEFNAVCLAYNTVNDDGSTKIVQVLRGLTGKLPKGLMAVVGENGAGKSTLFKLLRADHIPDSGEILINKQNIGRCTLNSLREAIAIVPQSHGIFDGTIKDNLLYGLHESDLNAPDLEVKLIDVIKRVKLATYIEKLPHKLDTMIDEKKASGGELQKMAIARALMIPHSHILILDEPTAALDAATKAEILTILREISLRKTVIVITHDKISSTDFDHIIVLAKGVIAEQGSYDDLMRGATGLFAEYNQAKPELVSHSTTPVYSAAGAAEVATAADAVVLQF